MRLAQLRAHLGLITLLALGVALRVFLMLEYQPAALSNPDSGRFLYFAHDGERLFTDNYGPAGYEALLRGLRLVTTRLEATVALQHLFGIAAALLVYAAMRRLGAPRWAALIPAGVLLVSGDELYLEHALLSESPFIVLLAGGLYAAIRGLTAKDDFLTAAWLACAGGLLAATASFRNVGLILAPVIVVWAAIAMPRGWRGRLIGAGASACGVGAVLGLYAILAAASGGHTGWTAVSGWNEYGRSAPFADCTKFKPPAGTRRLCQRTPPARRPASLFYLWYRGSPARAAFGGPPNHDALLGTFGRRAILAQPWDYLDQVVSELPRFVDWNAYHRRFSGGGPFLIVRRDPSTERQVEAQVRHDYSAARLSIEGGVTRIGEWQDTERLAGFVPGAFVVLALAGLLLARGLARRGALLFALAGGSLVLLPAMTLTLIVRYTMPPTPFVAAAAGIGAWAVVDRLRAWREPAAQPAPPA